MRFKSELKALKDPEIRKNALITLTLRCVLLLAYVILIFPLVAIIWIVNSIASFVEDICETVGGFLHNLIAEPLLKKIDKQYEIARKKKGN